MTNDKFRDAIELHFGDRTDIETKEFLGQLMRKRQFHYSGGEPKYPTQKQLDAAWNYLKGRETYTMTEETIKLPSFLRFERDSRNQEHYRNTKTGRFAKKEG